MTHSYIDRIPLKYLILFLFLITWVVYGNSILNGYNIDDELVTQQHRLTSKGVKAISQIYASPFYEDSAGISFGYRPTTLTSFAIEHQLFGESPHISHAINVLIYAITALLIFWLVKWVLPDKNNLLALLASLIFIIHPIHTEAVCNIKGRDELLALFFALIANIFFLKSATKKSLIIYFLLGSVAFFLALTSKLSALPFALLIPFSLILFRKPSLLHILISSAVLAGISYGVFSKMTIELPLLIGLSILVAPIVLYIIYNSGQIIRYVSTTRLGSPLNINNHYQSIPLLWFGVFFMVGISIIFHSYLFIAIALLLAATHFIRANFNSKYQSVILLGMTGLVINVFHNLNFLDLACLLPLLLVLLGESNRKWNNAWWVLATLFVINLATDIINSNGLAMMNLLVIGVLVYLGNLRNKFVKYAATILLFFVSVFSMYKGIYTIAFIWFFAGVYSLLKLNSKQKSGLKLASIGICILFAINSFTSIDFNEPIKSFYPNANLPTETEFLNERVLDFSENPILYELSAEKRLATSLLVSGKYLRLLIIPLPLRFYYGYNIIPLVGFVSLGVILSSIALLLLIGIAIYFFRKKPLISFSSLTLLLGILQFSNLILPAAGIMADRYIYTASLGFTILLAALLVNIYLLLNKINKAFLRTAFWAILGIIFLTSILYTFKRNQLWKDPLTLYRHDIKHLSQSAKAHNILANEIFKQSIKTENENLKTELLNEAIFHFKKCLEIYPKFPFAWLDMGNAYLNLGDAQSALEAFEASVKIDGHHGESYFKAGGLHESYGNYSIAEEYYLSAIEKNASLKGAYINLMALYFTQQDFDEGFDIGSKALKLWPEEINFYINMGNALVNINRHTDAINYFEKALSLQPENSQLIQNLIYLFELTGDLQKAEAYRSQLQ